MSDSKVNEELAKAPTGGPQETSNDSQPGLVIDDEARRHEESGGLDGLGLDEVTCLLDDSTIVRDHTTRITSLEAIADQQTKYFIEWAKMGNAVSTLAGHVALMARAFCVMEKRYGVTPENSMGEYLFKKMEGSIPDDMRRAAAEAGFNMSIEETPQKAMVTVKRRAPASPQSTPLKVARKDEYKPFSFEVGGLVFVSKEQPHIKTDGNMCVSYVDGMSGCMLHMVAEGLVPKFPVPVIEAAQKLVTKLSTQQKGNEQAQAERLSMFIQHLLKLFVGGKMKLPVVICAKLNPEAPRDSLKAFATAQGALGSQLLKVGATTTGLVGSDKKLSDTEKVFVVNVMQKSITYLQQVFDNWATSSGRFDVQRYVSDDGGASTSTIDVFDD